VRHLITALWIGCCGAAPTYAADAGQSATSCVAIPEHLQRARDALETAKTQLAAAKSNFGPARDEALQFTRAAIEETTRMAARCPNLELRPVPGTGDVRKGIGRHPHMSYSTHALTTAKEELIALDASYGDARARALELVSRALESVGKAFVYRGP
jgi:hypothetical protein